VFSAEEHIGRSEVLDAAMQALVVVVIDVVIKRAPSFTE